MRSSPLALFVLLMAVPAAAQAPCKNAREGFWISFGLGGAWLDTKASYPLPGTTWERSTTASGAAASHSPTTSSTRRQ